MTLSSSDYRRLYPLIRRHGYMPPRPPGPHERIDQLAQLVAQLADRVTSLEARVASTETMVDCALGIE